MNKDITLQYYNTNAIEYAKNTLLVDSQEFRKEFTELLAPGSNILDLGCGAGRDAKKFIEQGYIVTAVDGSEELCKIAEEYIGMPVLHMLFQDLSYKSKFDGIWACASLLHLEPDVLKTVLRKSYLALKPHGILYASFKYGTFEGIRDGRYYCDYTEEKLDNLLEDIKELKIKKQWISEDVQSDGTKQKWLSTIFEKVDTQK